MEAIQVLRRRIDTATELRSVTRTMKSLAAVRIRRYERAVHSLDVYARAVELGFQILLRSDPEILGRLSPPQQGRAAVVAFGSDQGLCGPLNRRMATRFRRTIEDASPDPLVAVVGARLAAELEGGSIVPDHITGLPGSADAITGRVQDLLLEIDDWRTSGVGRIHLVHPRPAGSRTSWDPVAVQLFPLDAERLRDLAEAPWPTHVLPTYSVDRRTLAANLTRELMFVTLYRAYAEDLAAINGARLIAMEGAERNISERLDQLTLRYNRRRQESITEELLDVVSGFEALG